MPEYRYRRVTDRLVNGLLWLMAAWVAAMTLFIGVDVFIHKTGAHSPAEVAGGLGMLAAIFLLRWAIIRIRASVRRTVDGARKSAPDGGC